MSLGFSFHERTVSTMRPSVLRSLCVVACAGLLTVGCGGDDDPPADAGTPAATVFLENEHNYTSTASLDMVPTVQVAPSPDTEICWDGMDTDLQCHTVQPDAGVRGVSFLRFDMTEAEVKERLVGAPIGSADIEDPVITYSTGGQQTCMQVGDFVTSSDDPIDIDQHFIAGDDLTYLVVVSSTETLPPKAISMVLLEPTSSGASTVNVGEGCNLLDFEAEIAGRTPLSIPAAAPWLVDWSKLTLDGQLLEFLPNNVDKLLVGFYPNMTPTQVQDDIFDLETNASPLWELAIGREKSADLADARVRETGGLGARFDGFNRGEGTWMLALMCDACSNPQPLALTVLDPSGD